MQRVKHDAPFQHRVTSCVAVCLCLCLCLWVGRRRSGRRSSSSRRSSQGSRSSRKAKGCTKRRQRRFRIVTIAAQHEAWSHVSCACDTTTTAASV